MQRLLLLCFVCLSHQAAATDACPPPGTTRASLAELKQTGFALEDDARRNQLAVGLLACTGDPDPAIRDGVVYEGLATWLRGQRLASETIDALYTRLLDQLRAADDPDGFRKPFAALLLAEVARTDRIEPAFSAARREELVQAAAGYLREVRDYRGFSETEGWRHGVAHGSDLVLQLVLNPAIDPDQVRLLLAAIAAQVAPPGEVFYVYGEPERLARAAFYAHRRGDLAPSDWATWLQDISDPAPLAAWSDAYSSQSGLARRHNVLAFLQALYLGASATGDEQGEALAAQVLGVLSRVRG
jgi:hypothetical protein